MICVICGKKAKYNEKLNIYYCEEHGLTTWVEERSTQNIPLQEVRIDEEVVLG